MKRPTGRVSNWLKSIVCVAAASVAIAGAQLAEAAPQRLFSTELDLPSRGVSQRVTRRENLEPNKTLVLFDEAGPGCVFHWWLTYTPYRGEVKHDRVHDLQLKVFYDGSKKAAIDLTLAQFFSILLDKDIYEVDNAAIKVLPKNACNAYFPMPFKTMRIELTNTGASACTIWFMADWHQYPELKSLTPLRLRVTHHAEFPAEPAGSFPMADLTGSGFVAGMIKGVRVRDRSDAWFHSGGDLWLLDGETNPHALRGIGGEDVFNMSFGIWDSQTDWVGAPYLDKTGTDSPLGSGYEGVMYRIFGPAPIWFDTSAVVRFGSKANDIETVVYAYVEEKEAPNVLTPQTWHLAGPFDCASEESFETKEWAEAAIDQWPDTYTPSFGQYIGQDGPVIFSMPVAADSEHGWCDFTRHFRGRQRTNNGTQPVMVSAYAVSTLKIKEGGNAAIHFGFDDSAALWVNGEELYRGKHDTGFAVQKVACEFPSGDIEIRVKLSNQNNAQWRLWAFSLTVER